MSKQPWQAPVPTGLRDRLAEVIHRTGASDVPLSDCPARLVDYRNADAVLPVVHAEIQRAVEAWLIQCYAVALGPPTPETVAQLRADLDAITARLAAHKGESDD